MIHLKKGVKRKWKTFKRRGLENLRTSGKTLTGTSTLMLTTETGKGRTAMNNEKIMIEAVIKAFVGKLKEKEQSVKIGIAWEAVVTDKDIDELVKEICGDD